VPDVHIRKKPVHSFRGQNALTVDVEDYFQVSAFEPYVRRDGWQTYESRLLLNMDRILSMFDAADVKGTFFFLGWVAEKYPQLLRKVVNLGHEIASHGYQHIRVCDQNANEFRQDIERTKKLLEDVAGVPVCGYRAASFSIDVTNNWARDVLAETGHRYSSSIYPIRHDRYSMREAARFPFQDSVTGVVELPVATIEFSGMRFPCAGGGYFRLLPYAWSKWGIRRVNVVDRRSAIFYFHPWELDDAQPRISGLDNLTKFRHYVNLKSTEKKLNRLLSDFNWATVKCVFGDIIGPP
jgi:polysaccharide deacetylase family protein (PEP-CTERM system associated)